MIARVGDWNSSLPTWLQTRIGTDLKGDPYSEEQYVELVQELHGDYLKPPPLGPKPVFPKKIYQTVSGSAPERLVPRVQSQDSVAPIDTSKPKPNAIAYAFYETKGPDAQYFKMYIRPMDSTNDLFSLETSDGERTQGTFYTVGRDFVRFDRKYVSRGYICTHKFNGTGRRDIDIP